MLLIRLVNAGDEVSRDEQCGSKMGKGYSNQIYNFRAIIDEKHEFFPEWINSWKNRSFLNGRMEKRNEKHEFFPEWKNSWKIHSSLNGRTKRKT